MKISTTETQSTGDFMKISTGYVLRRSFLRDTWDDNHWKGKNKKSSFVKMSNSSLISIKTIDDQKWTKKWNKMSNRIEKYIYNFCSFYYLHPVSNRIEKCCFVFRYPYPRKFYDIIVPPTTFLRWMSFLSKWREKTWGESFSAYPYKRHAAPFVKTFLISEKRSDWGGIREEEERRGQNRWSFYSDDCNSLPLPWPY